MHIILLIGRQGKRIVGGVAKESQMTESTPARSKASALEAFERLPNKKDFVAAEKFWSSNYIQHSAHVPAARDGFVGRLKSVPPKMRYENGLIMAEGDVLMPRVSFPSVRPAVERPVELFDLRNL
jgi:predicted SnoaL-like aldol condensation-catalyzing enzyme